MERSPMLNNPAPDFAELERILRGEEEPRRAHAVELHVDPEVLQVIKESYLGEPWIPPPWTRRSWFAPAEGVTAPYFDQLVRLYCSLGYDFVRAWVMWTSHPLRSPRCAEDTAQLSRGQREWLDQSDGLITSWDDFEQFPWDKIKADSSVSDFMAQCLPPGMKIVATAMFFEHVLEILIGYGSFFYLLHDEPELIARVFDQWGQKVYDYYESVIGKEEVGAIWHVDDLAFKTSTLLSPEALRRLVLPWLKRYSALAHEHGKMFWYHCCGNVYDTVIEYLIEDVHIDAFHSFQDEILAVADFKTKYGHRVAALGGVDVDRLARLDEPSLRQYVKAILDRCMPGGRFALGSGHSVTNFVPVESYIVLLEETRGWRH
jgi:uroporphyrinogen decarboxylase